MWSGGVLHHSLKQLEHKNGIKQTSDNVSSLERKKHKPTSMHRQCQSDMTCLNCYYHQSICGLKVLVPFNSATSKAYRLFPFAVGYWKIMIIFPTSGTLRNVLQNNSSETFCKHNLLFSNITIMKWIHGIQCWKHLNPDLPHACVTESFGPQLQLQLQLQLHNRTWCCTLATDVHTTATATATSVTTSIATLQLVFQN